MSHDGVRLTSPSNTLALCPKKNNNKVEYFFSPARIERVHTHNGKSIYLPENIVIYFS